MDRRDLAALFSLVTRRLIAEERPILDAHGLSMWEYSVLSQLAREPAPTQQALAETIEYDKTRLIPMLEALERQGLLTREPDPSDRRARVVRLTRRGRTRLDDARRDIREMEARVLDELGAAERTTLLDVLPRLARLPDRHGR